MPRPNQLIAGHIFQCLGATLIRQKPELGIIRESVFGGARDYESHGNNHLFNFFLSQILEIILVYSSSE